MKNIRRLFEIVKLKYVKTFPLTRFVLSKIGLSGLNFNVYALILAIVGGGVALPFALVSNTINKLGGKLALGSCGFIITTHCTLKCKNCNYTIPQYKHPENMNLRDILSDIDRLLTVADIIYSFQLVGGEPFMHKDINIIIDKITNTKKIKSLNIVTNGSIIPAQKVITSLQNKKITVQISGYPKEIVKNADKFMEILEQNKIRFTYSKNLTWKDTDIGVNKNRGFGQRKKVFEVCVSTVCNHMINGEYHICPVSANIMNNGIMKKNAKDFVNIREFSPQEAREKIKALLKRKEVSACSFCDGVSIYNPTIAPAEQID